ncbi:MAG: hypothetical protein O3A79_05015 [Candidatus Marinimicrobia bacterium]|nr:hypothetical protein [Candidatus Neomarinimicrobiota bacterium]
MGFLKDLLIGGTAYKAYKATKRPGVMVPPGVTMLGMEHEGFGSKWRIHYVEDRNRNVKKSFTITPGTSGRTSGTYKWKFDWY